MKPSVNIVTGEVNAGKTARMRELFRQSAKADGILSEKIFDREGFRGYRLVRLQGGETMELALSEAAYHGQFTESCRLGPFVFSEEAFRFGTGTMERLCADPLVGALFLDETGPLELRGKGFSGVIPAMLRSGKELYITVRSDCLQEFLRKFEIADYLLLPVPS